MTLRAELVRLGLRWFLKPGNRSGVTIATRRRHTARFERWVPPPPGDTETLSAALGGVAARRIATPASLADRHILFLHGGGYVTGSPELYRHITWRIAAAARARVWAIDYRLAPEHPFPAALDDAFAAWHGLVADGADPRRAAVVGDSAGGGLALALVLKLRDAGGPLPAAIVALSPWTDLALTGASLRLNAGADPMQNAADLPFLAAQYLARSVLCTLRCCDRYRRRPSATRHRQRYRQCDAGDHGSRRRAACRHDHERDGHRR
jgi:acetyl esterase/lipase